MMKLELREIKSMECNSVLQLFWRVLELEQQLLDIELHLNKYNGN